VRADCPDCRTADAASQVPMSDVDLVLYYSCARCHLVWANDFNGTAINGRGRASQGATVRPNQIGV